jgi:hypothetical protein
MKRVSPKAAVGAESHADAHLLGALLNGVGHEAVDGDSSINNLSPIDCHRSMARQRAAHW